MDIHKQVSNYGEVFDAGSTTWYRGASGDGSVSLREYFEVIWRGKLLIQAMVFLGILSALSYWFFVTPTYKTNALLEVRRDGTLLEDLLLRGERSELQDNQSVQGDIAILHSRAVLGRVVEDLRFDLIFRPRYLPVIGEGLARRLGADSPLIQSLRQLLELKGYAWGGESIEVERFEIPRAWLGKPFLLVAMDSGSYELQNPDGKSVGEGQIGVQNTFDLGPDEGYVIVHIAAMSADPGTGFELIRRSWLSAVNNLKNSLTVKETGRQSGVLSVTLEGHDPDTVSRAANVLVRTFLQKTIEGETAEASGKLEFLESQLPLVKARLDQAEESLNAFRTREQAVNLDVETKVLLEYSVELKNQLLLLQQRSDELARSFKRAHPEMKVLSKQIARVQSELGDLNARTETLPALQKELLRLTRDVQVNTNLYITLLENAQQQRVAEAGNLGKVRVVDFAVVPERPSWPKKGLVLVLGTLIGFFLGLASVFLRKSFSTAVADPSIVESRIALPVLTVVPHSKAQRRLARHWDAKHDGTGVLAVTNPADQSIESIRSLHTTVENVLRQAERPMLMVCSPTASDGKSFISANLATVLGRTGKRVLLIDGDMRLGQVHTILGGDREPGLSELAAGQVNIDRVIRHSDEACLDYIASGLMPPNPFELLTSQRLKQCMDTLNQRYDYIIVDAPPVLRVADSLVLGRLSNTAIMVVKEGAQLVSEIEESIRRLHHANVQIYGIVMNDAKLAPSYYAYGQRAYGIRQ